MLTELDDELSSEGIVVLFARVKGSVRDILTRAGLAERFGPESFHPTIEGAVSAFLNRHLSQVPSPGA